MTRVALVHDYLNQRGGAERVALEFARMWPEAPLYTSLYRAHSTFPAFARHEIRTSFLQRLPVDRGFRNLFPLYPLAFRSLGCIDADVVLVSSSAWAHLIRVAEGSRLVVYCHTPARWLYGGEYLGATRRQRAIYPLVKPLRALDRSSARRANEYVSNSNATRIRVRATYGIESEVVYPPVDVARFKSRPRGDRLLVVCRLLPYKRVDVVVDAARRAEIGLDIVGIGPSLDNLRRRAGPTVQFHGALDDQGVTDLMEGCRALCLPGIEDFGIVAVEAMAAGKPVIAFAGGGALEIVIEGKTGAFFDRYEPQAVLEALTRCDALDTSPAELARAAARFSTDVFRERLGNLVAPGQGPWGRSR